MIKYISFRNNGNPVVRADVMQEPSLLMKFYTPLFCNIPKSEYTVTLKVFTVLSKIKNKICT